MIPGFPMAAASREKSFQSFLQTPDTGNVQDYTFSSVNLGSEPGLVVVGAVVSHSSVNTRVIDEITIDGDIATLSAGGAGYMTSAIGYAESSGTIDIGVNCSGFFENCQITVWKLINFDSSTSVDTDVTVQGVATSVSTTIDAPADGLVLSVIGHFNENSISWANADELASSDVGFGGMRFAASEVSRLADVADASRTITASWTTGASSSMSSISFS